MTSILTHNPFGKCTIVKQNNCQCTDYYLDNTVMIPGRSSSSLPVIIIITEETSGTTEVLFLFLFLFLLLLLLSGGIRSSGASGSGGGTSGGDGRELLRTGSNELIDVLTLEVLDEGSELLLVGLDTDRFKKSLDIIGLERRTA